MGDVADSAGRRPAYIICFTIYILANLGLALCNSYAALFVLRCFQSTGSSATIAMCSAVVSDVSTPAERGKYMGVSIPLDQCWGVKPERHSFVLMQTFETNIISTRWPVLSLALLLDL